MSTIRSLFLVGTDTGVGKTTLGEGLLRLAQRRRLRIMPFKPAESGTVLDDPSSDAARLLRASAHSGLTLPEIAPYRLAQPLAPGLAARLESRVIPEHRLLRQANRLLASNSALLIEAAGGLLSPYGANRTPASLARLLSTQIAMDILLVSPNRLGAINQCALASLALKSFALRCVGIVLVNLAPGLTVAQRFNGNEIAAATDLPVLGELPFLPFFPLFPSLAPSPTPIDTIADALSADVDLGPLFSGALGCRRAQSP